MPAISVIIPNYNLGEYLDTLLRVLRAQSLEDIEIICVDDASSDSSQEVIRRHAQEDSRVRGIFLESNLGAANARNTGIEAAKGDYVCFIDADDVPETDDFLKNLYVMAVQNEACAVKGEYIDRHSGELICTFTPQINRNKDYFTAGYCATLFRKEVIDRFHIRFPKLSDMEDPVFAFNFASRASRILTVPDARLCITKRPDSITLRIPAMAQIVDKIRGLGLLVSMMNLKRDMAKECYVWNFAYWFVTVVQDSFRNVSAEAERHIWNFWDKIRHRLRYFESCLDAVGEFNPDLKTYLSSGMYEGGDQLIPLHSMINNARTISFDIFDTLLLRPFFSPSHVFRYLGLAHGEPKFAKTRMDSEKYARYIKKLRNPRCEDIDIDDIYRLMPSRLKYFKKLEMDFEETILRPNPEIKNYYEYALSLGKKIIITSDMYLPAEFLDRLLRKNGFDHFHKLYVSSEHGLCKGSGNLFRRILEDEKLRPDELLHIGDNPHSDFNAPKTLGIKTFYYRGVAERYINSFGNLNMKAEWQKWHSAEYSLFYGLGMLDWHRNREQSYFYRLGYRLGGLLLAAFCNAIHETACLRGIRTIVFIARDGFLLKKAFEILYPGENFRLVYAYANRMLCKKYAGIANVVDNEYANYVHSLDLRDTENILVDTVAIGFSSQKLLSAYAGRRFLGVYLTSSVDYLHPYINLTNCDQKTLIHKFGWDIVEYLLSSPELPVVDIAGGAPVYQSDPDPREYKRQKDFAHIMEGSLNFIRDLKASSSGNPLCPSIQSVVDALTRFRENPSLTDRVMMSAVEVGGDPEHKLYFNILASEEERAEKRRRFSERQAAPGASR